MWQWFKVRPGLCKQKLLFHSHLAINNESWYALLIINLWVRFSSDDAAVMASIIDLSESAGGSWFIILNSDSFTRRVWAIILADWRILSMTMFLRSSSMSLVSAKKIKDLMIEQNTCAFAKATWQDNAWHYLTAKNWVQ